MKLKTIISCSCVFALMGCAAQSVTAQTARERQGDFGEVFGLARVSGVGSTLAFPQSRADWVEIVRKVNSGEMDGSVFVAMTMSEEMPDDLNSEAFQKTYKLAYHDYFRRLVTGFDSETEYALPNPEDLNEIWRRMQEVISCQKQVSEFDIDCPEP